MRKLDGLSIESLRRRAEPAGSVMVLWVGKDLQIVRPK